MCVARLTVGVALCLRRYGANDGYLLQLKILQRINLIFVEVSVEVFVDASVCARAGVEPRWRNDAYAAIRLGCPFYFFSASCAGNDVCTFVAIAFDG